jgi:hypothetical protein
MFEQGQEYTKVNRLLSSSPVPHSGESTTLYSSSSGTNDSTEEELLLDYDDDTSGLQIETFYENKHDDPYADVRDRMMLLAQQDRERHLTDNGDSYSVNLDSPAASIPFFAALTTYFGYAVLIIVGHVRDICASIFRSGRYLSKRRRGKRTPDDHQKQDVRDSIQGYSPLLKSWENFYTRRLYHRIQDCFNRPIASNPGATIQVLERVSVDGNKTMQVLGDSKLNVPVRDSYVRGEHVSFVTQFLPSSCTAEPELRIARDCLNLGSYNYLGFADDWNATCQKPVLEALNNLPVSCSASRYEAGTTIIHKKLESLVVRSHLVTATLNSLE